MTIGFALLRSPSYVCIMKFILMSLSLLTATPALAEVVADAAWSRATAPRQDVGAAYVTLRSDTADRLLSVTTPVAREAQLHEMSMAGGVMRMREVPGIPLPAGQKVSLAPGGLHLMLVGLNAPLTVGQTFPLRLTFEHAPPKDVTVTVRTPGGQ